MTDYDDAVRPTMRTRVLHIVLLHRWEIWAVNLSGHQSWRERRCLRCTPRRLQRQRLSYFGKPYGPWAEVAR